ncbi:MAG: AraC family transcriptional regulator [Myxococcota bacterium]
MEDIAWQTVARVLHRVQSELDAPWDLDRMAHIAGYERHHLAHLFRDVVGEPPARYVRRLRLERAAGDLLRGMPVAETAGRAVYGSAEAFSRAFKRQFGVAPLGFARQVREGDLSDGSPPGLHGSAGDGPPGLDATARVEAIGPFYGWTVIVPSFEAPHLGYGMAQLFGACPPDGPWQMGGIAQPWGWLTEEATREFRCLRLRERDDRAPPPPLVPWSWPRDWFAVFDFEGPLDQIEAACGWMARWWPERVGLRLGYGPLFSLLETMADPSRARARLHLAVRPLAA